MVTQQYQVKIIHFGLATYTKSIQEEEYGPVEQRTEFRFSIKELDGLSEDEIANLAAQQRLTHRQHLALNIKGNVSFCLCSLF